MGNLILDTVLLGGVIAVAGVVGGTLILGALGILLVELLETRVRKIKRWLRQSVRGFLAAARESRVATGGRV